MASNTPAEVVDAAAEQVVKAADTVTAPENAYLPPTKAETGIDAAGLEAQKGGLIDADSESLNTLDYDLKHVGEFNLAAGEGGQ